MDSDFLVTHPEIDIRPILYGLLPKSKENPQDLDMTTLEFAEVHGGKGTVHSWLTQKSFEKVWIANQTNNDRENTDAHLRIIFVADPHFGSIFTFGEREHSSVQELNNTAAWLHQNLGVPLSFFYYMDPYRGSRNLGMGSFLRYGNDGNLMAIDGFYQYGPNLTAVPAHVWFSHSLKTFRSSTYVIYNIPDGAKRHITASITGHSQTTVRPFAIDAFLGDETIHSWNEEVSTLRSKLLRHENNYPVTGVSSSESSLVVAELHGLSQRLHITRENLNDLRERLKFLSTVRQDYMANLQVQLSADAVNSVTESFALISSRTDGLGRWVGNYIERTGIRIALYFNLTTQSDSKTNLDIARLTTKIAVATQRDSSSMITMVFFDKETRADGREVLSISAQWWIFPTVTVPLTVLVFAIWLVWKHKRTSSEMKDIQTIHESLPDDQGEEKNNPAILTVPVVRPRARSIELPVFERARSVGSLRSAMS
ncbi:hypothetical protein CVT26_013495 [Gymnopilus dilepis]|uniref:Uncharacterized protein n=1 Tax=Gymnopilus dilepis TaxID=231916 RepID=A0A409Y5M3_9AGAR|nr:hypothetical protein CVT26_013495 [Gymnopilus dilepis]